MKQVRRVKAMERELCGEGLVAISPGLKVVSKLNHIYNPWKGPFLIP
jgi:hypothetical protein